MSSPLSSMCCFEQSMSYSKNFRYIFLICGGQLLVLGGMYSFSFADFPTAFAICCFSSGTRIHNYTLPPPLSSPEKLLDPSPTFPGACVSQPSLCRNWFSKNITKALILKPSTTLKVNAGKGPNLN